MCVCIYTCNIKVCSNYSFSLRNIQIIIPTDNRSWHIEWCIRIYRMDGQDGAGESVTVVHETPQQREVSLMPHTHRAYLQATYTATVVIPRNVRIYDSILNVIHR